MIILSPQTSYEVGDIVAKPDLYRIYLCKQADSGNQYLLQIASEIGNNGPLDLSAYVLGKLQDSAKELEAQYEKVKENPRQMLNYQLGFPTLVESFISKEQGNRRINILKFSGVDDVSTVVPLHNVRYKHELRVDVRTSIWIMGKWLKILAFAHDNGIAVSDLGLGNTLIEPDKHYVIIFNWAQAQLVSGDFPQSTARAEIKKIARSVIELLDGSVEDGVVGDGSERETLYCNYLIQLAKGGESSALVAHREFYDFVDQLWERGFHNFTTLPIKAV